MPLNAFKRWSLKSRVTVFTLVIFLISLWSLSYYASRMLRDDLTQMLGQQQFATVSMVATELNQAPVSYTHLDVYKRQILDIDVLNSIPPCHLIG